MNRVTSEPAKEVFCKYYLKNLKQEVPIAVRDDGYEIMVPYRPGSPLQISDEEWRKLNMEAPEKLEELYKNAVQEVSTRNLLDLEDGGCGSMVYREHSKVQQNDKLLNIIHFVQITAVEVLQDTLA